MGLHVPGTIETALVGVTGSVADYGVDVTVNDASDLYVGAYIKIATEISTPYHKIYT